MVIAESEGTMQITMSVPIDEIQDANGHQAMPFADK